MLRTYKYPEIPDQDKPDSGDLLFGLQTGKSVNPLPFFATGNNSAIVSFTAVEFDQFRKEVGRIDLDTALIDVDAPNNLYNVDGLTNYTAIITNGVYRFEFENDFDLWRTEYFKIIDKSAIWILQNGFWVDGNMWIDEAFWID